MNQEKISRLIQLLVEREVKRLIPAIKKQILSEMSSQPPQQVRPKPQQQRQVVKNSFLNELILSSAQTDDDDDYALSDEELYGTKPNLSAATKPVSIISQRELATENVNAANPAVQKVMNAMNRNYGDLVKKMSEKRPNLTPQSDEDLSWLDSIG